MKQQNQDYKRFRNSEIIFKHTCSRIRLSSSVHDRLSSLVQSWPVLSVSVCVCVFYFLNFFAFKSHLNTTLEKSMQQNVRELSHHQREYDQATIIIIPKSVPSQKHHSSEEKQEKQQKVTHQNFDNSRYLTLQHPYHVTRTSFL